MQLIIYKQHDKDLYNFVKYIASEVEDILLDNIHTNQLGKVNQFLSSVIIPKDGTKTTPLTAELIIRLSANNLSITERESDYAISIDTEVEIPHYNVSLYAMARLINDGNIHLQAYPIFEDAFKFVATNINSYYMLYNKEKKF